GAVFMSKIRPTFLSHRELLEVTGLPILGTISMKWTDEEKLRQRKSLYGFVFSSFALLMFYIALMMFMYLKS
ncbi:MAG: chain length-determining protein, partial [Undibacterium sp.]|nr:chain length-determining protein [Undibacterium sp.]